MASLCQGIIEAHDFEHESLYAVLRNQYGLSLTHAEQIFEARAASETEAKYLELQTDAPVLSISRVTFSANDKPVEYVQSVYRGDRYKFRAILRRV
jgi:GntR family transcriptional regulator